MLKIKLKGGGDQAKRERVNTIYIFLLQRPLLCIGLASADLVFNFYFQFKPIYIYLISNF